MRLYWELTASREDRPALSFHLGNDLFGNGEEVHQLVTPGCRRLLGSGALRSVGLGKVESMKGSVPSFFTLQEAEVPVVSGEGGGIDGQFV